MEPGKWPLSRKILTLALLNLILIAAVLAMFAQWQFGLSIESLLLGPARDRIMAIANAAGRDLDVTPYAARTNLLAAYSQRYGVDFFLVDPRGESLTGDTVKLPEELAGRLGRGRGGPERPPPDGKGRGMGPPTGGQAGGPPSDPAFLTITRNPLLYWVGVRIPTDGPNGERGVPAVLLLRAS